MASTSILSRDRNAAVLRIALLAAVCITPVLAQQTQFPWMDKSLSPDQRAGLVLKQMALDEKIQLVHGTGGFEKSGPRSNGGAGMVLGIPRLVGLPDLQLADSAVGVRAAAEAWPLCHAAALFRC